MTSRRRWLSCTAAWCASGWLAGCDDLTGMVSGAPLLARFDVPGARSVRLAYWDADHFSLSPEVGSGRTLAVGGRIYLVVPPSLSNPGGERVLHLGALGASPAPLPKQDTPATGPVSRFVGPAAKLGVTLRQLDWQPDPKRPPVPVIVSPLPALAAMQYVIDTRLRGGMDMSLCGDAIGRMMAAFPRALTGRGLAVVAHGSGVQLAEAPRTLTAPDLLPAGVDVEDYQPRGPAALFRR